MNSSHTLGFIILATLFNIYTAPAQTQSADDGGSPKAEVISAIDLQEQIDGKDARSTTFLVTFAPGAASVPHRHPGAVFGYVVEGEFEFKVEGKPARTLKAGETFYEPTMVLHEVSRNPGRESTTRVLAVIVHPRDAERLVIPEETGN